MVNSKSIILFFLVNTFLFSQGLHLNTVPASGSLIAGFIKDASSVYLNNQSLNPDSTGHFIFGFDRDESGSTQLTIKYTSGELHTKELYVKQRKYSEQRLHVNPELVEAPNFEKARIKKEKELIRNAYKIIDGGKGSYYLSGFRLPLDYIKMTSEFGCARILNGEEKDPHNGVDFSTMEGTPVYAAGDGIVRLAEENFYFAGGIIIIDHGSGLSTSYLHLSSVDIEEGYPVLKGEMIGRVGSTGRSTGPHLHWGCRWYNKRIDPLSLLDLDFGKPGHAR